MDSLDLLRVNLLSPMVLAFFLGITATLVRSDLKFPGELYTALSIYLLLAIGIKGGVELSVTPLVEFWPTALAAILLGVLTPIWTYWIVRRVGRLDVANSAALAAHYGSVSAVTFIAAQTYLQHLNVPFEGFTPTLLAILEVPAIVIALMIANHAAPPKEGGGPQQSGVLQEIIAGRSILLLVGGTVLGYLTGPGGMAQVSDFFVDPFRGVLTLFLLELGMVAARRLRDILAVGPFLLGFGIVMPLINGAVGAIGGSLAGMTVGGTTILAVLVASSSYIAAPAAVRIALPQANPSYYLTASLAITFPFNLILGIPIYHAFAQLLERSGL